MHMKKLFVLETLDIVKFLRNAVRNYRNWLKNIILSPRILMSQVVLPFNFLLYFGKERAKAWRRKMTK
ncbi:hypothetical protein A6E07_15320 [Vibrio cyclitrophicus]|nr:hypothetical protein A6E07_15320 [Vibrio cyclitrophicus]